MGLEHAAELHAVARARCQAQGGRRREGHGGRRAAGLPAAWGGFYLRGFFWRMRRGGSSTCDTQLAFSKERATSKSEHANLPLQLAATHPELREGVVQTTSAVPSRYLFPGVYFGDQWPFDLVTYFTEKAS